MVGAEAAHAAGLTTAPGLYVCPLCLGEYADLETLTWEDVPARRAGGRPLVLTCKACNNIGGRTVNQHAAAQLDYEQLQSGLLSRDRHAWLKLNKPPALKVTLRADLSGARALGTENSPEVISAWRGAFDALSQSGVGDVTVQASLPPGEHRPWQARVAELRHAFLATFALLGYSYVASPELRPVREQVQNFETDRIKIFGATTVVSDSQSPWDVRVCNWDRRVTAVVVRFGRRLVYLPSLVPGGSAAIYDYLPGMTPGQEVHEIVLDSDRKMVCVLDRDRDFRGKLMPWLSSI
jgi:hypothetical protein